MAETKTTGQDLAFPPSDPETYGFGLTTREYFAAIALGGLLANPNQVNANQWSLAEQAVEMADELLICLNRME